MTKGITFRATNKASENIKTIMREKGMNRSQAINYFLEQKRQAEQGEAPPSPRTAIWCVSMESLREYERLKKDKRWKDIDDMTLEELEAL